MNVKQSIGRMTQSTLGKKSLYTLQQLTRKKANVDDDDDDDEDDVKGRRRITR